MLIPFLEITKGGGGGGLISRLQCTAVANIVPQLLHVQLVLHGKLEE